MSGCRCPIDVEHREDRVQHSFSSDEMNTCITAFYRWKSNGVPPTPDGMIKGKAIAVPDPQALKFYIMFQRVTGYPELIVNGNALGIMKIKL